MDLDLRFRVVGVIAFLLSLGLTPMFRELGVRWGLTDKPGERKSHIRPVPFLGGAALFLAFMIPSLLVLRDDAPVAGILLPSTLIFAIGFVDDVRGLPAWFRLVGQLLASLLLIRHGIVIKIMPWYWLNVTITLVGVIGITNALNFLDNMDGLASGLVCMACMGFFFVAWLTGQRWLGIYAVALVGSCLGFLTFNVRPASIFMGDSGSTFLGFNIATLAVMGDWSQSRWIACCIPTVIMSILIFDTVLTTIMRVRTGKVSNLREWVDYAGQDHLSHRLVELGMEPGSAVLAIHLVGLSMSIVAVLLLGANLLVALGVIVMVVLFFANWFLLVKDIPGLDVVNEHIEGHTG